MKQAKKLKTLLLIKSLPLLPLLPLLLLLQVARSASYAPGLEVKVAQVVSRQTLEVTGMGEPTRATQVRLVGIDAPVCSSSLGKAAKRAVRR